ncbi:MAG: CpsB/CapC family capsule biosynthesis tyrosine phosphatase [Solirubrobacteraceae bacterium]
MIDLHCHVLPGIDDGPPKIASSIALARAAAGMGVRTIVATPHVSGRYPNEACTIARLTENVAVALKRENVDMEIRMGAEIAVEHIPEIATEQLTRLGLGGGKWLLIEPPFGPLTPSLGDAVTALQRAGHRVVLAHPERCPTFHRDPAMLETLVRGGALTSVTAGALVGRFGKDVRHFALDMATAKLIHNVASDAHDAQRRRPGLREEIEHAGLGTLTEWLTQEVPAAILDGEDIPPRPRALPGGTKRRRALWRREHASTQVSRWPQRN